MMYYGRYGVGVNAFVCFYSIAQAFAEILRLVWPASMPRSTSGYSCSLFLDQAGTCILAYIEISVAELVSPTGIGISAHIVFVGGRVSQPSVGVETRQGPVRQRDQHRGVVFIPWVPCAVSQRAHLHG